MQLQPLLLRHLLAADSTVAVVFEEADFMVVASTVAAFAAAASTAVVSTAVDLEAQASAVVDLDTADSGSAWDWGWDRTTEVDGTDRHIWHRATTETAISFVGRYGRRTAGA